ncbi:hypothetical protein D8I35_05250 [Corticibacter populi]|uniref:Uncharacterized protein n=1 Tax=Corticibacter populi TaxID=1550736 RepID=A0A3M6R0W2_9BURK|nr:hypothetical protein D8I35_05250 [Corticibacter populi]
MSAARAAVAGRVTERALARDVTRAGYSATSHVLDSVYVQDFIPARAGAGTAWTAAADGWAMSQYDQYPFDSIAVVDGVAFATGSDGVWALRGGDEIIRAKLTTGKMDVGQGGLTHPMYAYLEYELDGSAVMTVTQTQGGSVAQSWTYPLDGEPAAALTNGRFKFGRGLRGRHFTFALELVGERAHINDLYVVADATKRRI